MDVQMSKKGKLAILVALFVLAFPIYALSDMGMDKWVAQAWEKADDSKTPDRLIFLAKVYNTTYREDKAEALYKEWLKHYGGNESEKDPPTRYMNFDAGQFPWDEDHPRPPQKGEDYRENPHPRTAEVLIQIALFLERNHRYLEAKHIFDIVLDDKNNVPKDAESLKQAQQGLQRNSSGNRSF